MGIEDYMPLQTWVNPTPFGGYYNWDGPNYYPYAGIAPYETPASTETLEKLDAVLDDGDLSSGLFRLTDNDRYTYIIDE